MDFPGLARESQQIWEQNARWWDARIAEGDRWHTQLIGTRLFVNEARPIRKEPQ